jgi:sulfur relay (sulfurtransferase) complex TusBCD TusD component (DsrE family)
MIIINQIPISHAEKVIAMIKQAEKYLLDGKSIQRVFFYSEAVWQCISPHHKPWLDFYQQYDVPLSVCPNAVVNRKIESLITEPFALYSLTELFLEMASVEEVICVD